ncbi:MAG: hypothetical protein FWD45_07315 [Coriobacteriia bacterium]|nr:hypothetical protein [Coriobacteriia bacterium]
MITLSTEQVKRLHAQLIRETGGADGLLDEGLSNKRIGTYVMLVLLDLNKLSATFSDAEIVRIGLEQANGVMSDTDLARFILSHME